ncbi:MAG: hypothetical protein ACYDBK_09090 [Thermoplasmataceae archaeon]
MSGISTGTDNQAIRETRDILKSLSESSIRLERDNKALNVLTAILAIETLALIVLTVMGIVHI